GAGLQRGLGGKVFHRPCGVEAGARRATGSAPTFRKINAAVPIEDVRPRPGAACGKLAEIFFGGRMLALLNISNFALISALKVEFERGLNLLTGETGSGKSIIVDALGVLIGDRTRPSGR